MSRMDRRGKECASLPRDIAGKNMHDRAQFFLRPCSNTDRISVLRQIRLVILLERSDLGFTLESQSNFIQALEQSLF